MQKYVDFALDLFEMLDEAGLVAGNKALEFLSELVDADAAISFKAMAAFGVKFGLGLDLTQKPPVAFLTG